jgi:ribosomal protein S18 acetylase RimI-like enzyme
MLQIVVIGEESPELDNIRNLFREYEQELGEDLCFQSFEAELKDPLKKYGPPTGTLLLAYWKQEIAGCIAFTAMPASATCEMKRLYVKPAFRKYGIGRKLAEELLKAAVEKGYTTMKLDTLEKLQAAIRLYEQLGFEKTGAYYDNPLPEVVYMEKKLDTTDLL